MTVHARLAAASLVLTLLAAGCSPEADRTSGAAAAPTASPETAAETGAYPFRIGAVEAVALKDGDLTLPNQPGASPWSDPAAIRATLRGAGQDGDAIHLSVQPLLVKTGDRVVLIDTGAGGQMGTANRLPASLAAAGVAPAQVTDVLISHAHGDHVGGLVANGALVFPNAAIRMSAAEWSDLQGQAEMADLVRVIRPRVEPFTFGAEIAPGVTPVALEGHTPGHSGFDIASGDQHLLYFGDAMHSSILSVQRPEWKNDWDSDSAAAIATRQGLLERGATQRLRLYGNHFPFPGLGRIERRDDGFVWVPETAARP
jgi:glyoxylase-like metal-dependent hydrolase (beta-lactamase superfamily II)